MGRNILGCVNGGDVTDDDAGGFKVIFPLRGKNAITYRLYVPESSGHFFSVRLFDLITYHLESIGPGRPDSHLVPRK